MWRYLLTDRKLRHRFAVDHPVLEFETTDCGQGGSQCELSDNGVKRHDAVIERN
ncbi:MAG: hypothetical protein KFF50_14240 [Desulfatitalea sp.]|nr:hypothetical protein [Desulfatitalea sp.]